MNTTIESTPKGSRRTRAAVAALALASLALGACTRFPAPGAASPPLTGEQTLALLQCQQGVIKAQARFARLQRKGLQRCVGAVLAAKVAFENGITSAELFESGLVRLRAKCTKRFDKIGAASTKLVDAILASCKEAEDLVLGPYDGLRLQASEAATAGSLEGIAGIVCTGTEVAVDAELWLALPRLIELLDSLGPEFTEKSEFSEEGAYPNLPMDARCPTIDSLMDIFNPTP